MNAFLDLFRSIPKELWTPLGTLAAGIFTAAIAFTAVLIQNAAAGRRHRRELEHDARQRELEGASELRKIVYLEVLDSLAQTSALFTDLWNLNVPESDIQTALSQKLKAASNRLYAVAGMETIRAMDEVSRAALETVRAVFPIRLSYAAVKNSDERVTRFFERAVKRRDELLDALAEDKELTTEKRTTLEAERERMQGIVDRSCARLIEVHGQRVSSLLDVQLLGQDKAKDLQRALWRVTLSLRRELGFPIDESVFNSLMEAFADSSVTTLRSLYKTMQDDIEKSSKEMQEAMKKPARKSVT